MKSLDEELRSLVFFEDAVRDLATRYRSSPSLMHACSSGETLSLQWILERQQDLRRAIIESLDDGGPILSPVKRTSLWMGKWRDIYITTWVDRVLLMMVARLLNRRLEPLWHSRLYSFRKGLGPWHAQQDLKKILEKATADLHILKRDVTQFGDSIPTHRLLGKLFGENFFKGQTLAQKIVFEALHPEIKGPDSQCLWSGIPSGSPLVPILENYYLLELDHALVGDSEFYGRYGDDFVVVVDSARRAREVHLTIEEKLRALGLRTKPEKNVDVVLKNSGIGFVWLGRWIGFRGELGPKPERLRLAVSELKRNIFDLVWRSRDVENPSLRDRMLRRGLKRLYANREDNLLSRVFSESESLRLKRELSDLGLRYYHSALRKVYKLRSRQAWAWVRRTQFVRSLASSDPSRGSNEAA